MAAGDFYGANVGLTLVFGLLVALPTWYLSGYVFGQFLGRKYPYRVEEAITGSLVSNAELPERPASPRSVIGILLIPMLLIFGNTGLTTLGAAGIIDTSATWAKCVIFLGQTPIALLITTIVAMVVLGLRRGEGKTAVEKTVESSLAPICSVVLITGAGGMFGGVLRTPGIGDALADSMSNLGIPVILACFLITLATAAGSVFGSHVNDSGFWLVGRLMGIDVATTLRTWTVNQALISSIDFGFVLSSTAPPHSSSPRPAGAPINPADNAPPRRPAPRARR